MTRSSGFAALSIALAGISGCLTMRSEPPRDRPPHVQAGSIGKAFVVYDTRDSCEEVDVPDAPARAFRDSATTIHLIASHWVARAMTGPDLLHLKHDCRVIYRSPQDRDPSHFNYKNWLYSFFTSDGLHIAALVHSEFDADEIPGMCATPLQADNCWWNTITFAQSGDGGYSFSAPHSPRNLVAALPWRYTVGNRSSAYGYNMPSNILKEGMFYYALINDWPHRSQKFGPCLIRTENVFDPASWRAWNGKEFALRFSDPYAETVSDPERAVCEPVLAGTADSLVKQQTSGLFLETQYVPNDAFGAAGFYMRDSRDLIHWSQPSLIVSLAALRAQELNGRWRYDYVSLIDPRSADRNFTTVSDTPLLFYTRFDEAHPPYTRTLMARPVTLIDLARGATYLSTGSKSHSR